MDLTQILRPEAVKTVHTVTSKKRLFQELGEIVFSAYGLTAGDVCEALQERESLGPTGVGHGIALPHARIQGVEEVLGVEKNKVTGLRVLNKKSGETSTLDVAALFVYSVPFVLYCRLAYTVAIVDVL